MTNTNHKSYLWLLPALSIFVWAPLLHPAYFLQAHDARHSLFYVAEFDQALRDGYLWPRWSPDFAFGYGYPLFNIYAPLAIYLAELLHLLGLSIPTAVKTMYALATIGAGLGMYGFVRRLFGDGAGLVAGLAYMIAPFHLVELYVRSAYAEYVSLMWLPLIAWAFTELIARPSWPRAAAAGFSYGLLALTHHTTLFTFTPFLMLYILVLIAGKARLNLRIWRQQALANAGAGLLGIGLAGIYLIPVLFEQQFIKVEQWTGGSYNFSQHFVYFSQFLSPFWGYGYAGPGPIDFMPYQIGIVIYGLLAFMVIALIVSARQETHRGTAIIFLAAALGSVWLMSPLADGMWHTLPIIALVQFPWRLLIITSLSLAVTAGALVNFLQPDRISLMLVSLVLVLASYAYAQPEYTPLPEWASSPLAVINWDSGSVQDRVGMVIYTTVQPTTSLLEAEYRAGKPLSAGAIIAGEATITAQKRGGASAEVTLTANSPATVQFYTYDYPGWQVTMDDKPLTHRHEPPYGLITVDVPAGEHTLRLRMGTTLPRTAGGVLSLLSLVIMAALGWKKEQV